MAKISNTFRKYFQYAKESAEGAALLREHDKIWQFDLTHPFYVDIKKGSFTVKDGWCKLDWQGKDWRKMNVIGTSEEALKDIMTGKMTPSQAMFEGKFAIASRGYKTETGWFIQLFRTAREEMEKKAPELVLKA
jgi:putative sterol carrier protein